MSIEAKHAARAYPQQVPLRAPHGGRKRSSKLAVAGLGGCLLAGAAALSLPSPRSAAPVSSVEGMPAPEPRLGELRHFPFQAPLGWQTVVPDFYTNAAAAHPRPERSPASRSLAPAPACESVSLLPR